MKVIWITGASSGIGEALSYELAKQGNRLVLSARRVAELERVKNACETAAENILVLPLDLLQHETMEAKASEVIAHFGRIDVVIHNGGISQRSLVNETDLSVYKKLMDVDFLGVVALTKAVLPYFIKQKSGQFGVMSSLMGKFASPLRSGYCAAKHALHGFFDALRMEHEADNIKITIICPGFIRTNISMNAVKGNGEAQAKMDNAQDGGMAVDQCASQIIKALNNEKKEVLIGGKETLGVYIKRFFPSMIDRVVKKSSVT